MMTGSNPSLGLALLMEGYRRGQRGIKGYMDSAYCLDAPTILAAGSCVRDRFGSDPDDWMPRESMAGRDVPVETEETRK